jgi:ferredoxin
MSGPKAGDRRGVAQQSVCHIEVREPRGEISRIRQAEPTLWQFRGKVPQKLDVQCLINLSGTFAYFGDDSLERMQ